MKLGRVALDGTKIKANASKHKAMSYARMAQQEEAIREQVKELMYGGGGRRGRGHAVRQRTSGAMNLPDDVQRRETRLARIREARRVVEEGRARESEGARKTGGRGPAGSQGAV